MDALTRVVKRHAYNSYSDRAPILEPIFQLFLTADDGTYLMRDVAKVTNVPLTTSGEFSLPDQCSRIPRRRRADHGSFIRINFIDEGRPLTRTTLQPLIRMLVQDLIAQNVLDERRRAWPNANSIHRN
jgi:hypothetical protein